MRRRRRTPPSPRRIRTACASRRLRFPSPLSLLSTAGFRFRRIAIAGSFGPWPETAGFAKRTGCLPSHSRSGQVFRGRHVQGRAADEAAATAAARCKPRPSGRGSLGRSPAGEGEGGDAPTRSSQARADGPVSPGNRRGSEGRAARRSRRRSGREGREPRASRQGRAEAQADAIAFKAAGFGGPAGPFRFRTAANRSGLRPRRGARETPELQASTARPKPLGGRVRTFGCGEALPRQWGPAATPAPISLGAGNSSPFRGGIHAAGSPPIRAGKKPSCARLRSSSSTS
jgi:hypothetical protein